MTLACITCNKSFEMKAHKYFYLFPSFCSKDCFASFLSYPFADSEKIKGQFLSYSKKKYTQRSAYENAFSKFLDDYTIPYYYEPYMFTLGDNKIYVPDFYIIPSGIFIEVKGVLDRRSIYNIVNFVKTYPVPILLVDGATLRRLKIWAK